MTETVEELCVHASTAQEFAVAALSAEQHNLLSVPDSMAIDSIPTVTERDIATQLEALGLFDRAWYASTYLDVVEANVDPSEHFFGTGHAEGRKPNAVFESGWYVATNPDVKNANLNPLVHYALYGEQEGRKPSPYFDPIWYRNKYNLGAGQLALAHYLKNRSGPFSPIEEFDSAFYLETYQDVFSAKVDPFEHYLHVGYREGRNPSRQFDTTYYILRYMKGCKDQNPLVHYLEHRSEGNIVPHPHGDEATIPLQVKKFTKPGSNFEELRPLPSSTNRRAKVLAYYLPQFHSFTENDKWWGAGFTEWTNIARGIPRFKDHYQPRIPRDLGFYSLEDTAALRKQVALAKAAGLFGFVFYYYWFNGKRLLERPLEQLLKSEDIPMPFCLMWANENWTRRWDGMDAEVLISQGYRADDDSALIDDFARHFSDPRYIRIQGRPLLMIYRPGLIPNTAKAIGRWRKLFSERHGEDPIFIMGQSFDDVDPRGHGMDGAIEFPPHKVTKSIPLANADFQILDESFAGQIFRYDDVVKYSLDEPAQAFPLIKTVVPSWDNDARRQGNGLVIQGSTPAKYEAWLAAVVERAQRAPFFGEPVVCINAWNEWCEGAYLEPDLHFGAAYLNATGRAISGLTHDASRPRLLLVGHDAFPSGAQQLLLNIGRTLRRAFGVEIEFLLLGGGQLENEYAAIAPLTVLSDPASLSDKIRDLRERGITSAIVNTSASGRAVPVLTSHGIDSVLLVHEMPRLLREKRLEEIARTGIAHAKHVIFPSVFVGQQLLDCLGLQDSDRFIVRPQGTYKKFSSNPEMAPKLRATLGIGSGGRLVLGAGYADMRKGFDLFLQTWRLHHSENPKVHFAWLGGIDPELQQWLAAEISEAVATKTFHMAGFQKDVSAFFAASDAFILTSREDPFPTVVLEALSVGLPTIAFDKSGGIPEFLSELEIGDVVPYCDVPAMVEKLKELFSNGKNSKRLAEAQEVVATQFRFSTYVRDLLNLTQPQLASVTVAIPNYNYARCLSERLSTVFDQTHPVQDIVVMDDASTDDSIAVIKAIATERNRTITLQINEVNSGSVFAQWEKAANFGEGEFIWLAEADDASEPGFLSNLLAVMNSDPTIQIGFTDSKSIDADGALVYESYKPYFATVEPDALNHSEVFAGVDFATRFLSVKNTILNVSSVVWRREALQRALAASKKELAGYRMAGDWHLYLECLADPKAKIAYVAEPLNVHRRHQSSVTHTLDAHRHLAEIKRIHELVMRRFGPSKAVRTAQTAYRSEIETQLTNVARKSKIENDVTGARKAQFA